MKTTDTTTLNDLAWVDGVPEGERPWLVRWRKSGEAWCHPVLWTPQHRAWSHDDYQHAPLSDPRAIELAVEPYKAAMHRALDSVRAARRWSAGGEPIPDLDRHLDAAVEILVGRVRGFEKPAVAAVAAVPKRRRKSVLDRLCEAFVRAGCHEVSACRDTVGCRHEPRPAFTIKWKAWIIVGAVTQEIDGATEVAREADGCFGGGPNADTVGIQIARGHNIESGRPKNFRVTTEGGRGWPDRLAAESVGRAREVLELRVAETNGAGAQA